jgi:T-Q ester bond containing domain
VYYDNLIPGEEYELQGELVWLGSSINYTGIIGSATFTASPSGAGTVPVTFTLNETQLSTLAGKQLFIFQTLYDSSGTAVAFDGADVHPDPWFTSTDEWFTIAPASTLAFTGLQPVMPAIVGFGFVLMGALLVLVARNGLVSVVLPKRKRRAH